MKNIKNTFGLLLSDRHGNRITIWQARSGQIFIGFSEGIPLTYENIVNAGIDTSIRDIEDFDELKYKKFYHLKSNRSR